MAVLKKAGYYRHLRAKGFREIKTSISETVAADREILSEIERIDDHDYRLRAMDLTICVDHERGGGDLIDDTPSWPLLLGL